MYGVRPLRTRHKTSRTVAACRARFPIDFRGPRSRELLRGGSLLFASGCSTADKEAIPDVESSSTVAVTSSTSIGPLIEQSTIQPVTSVTITTEAETLPLPKCIHDGPIASGRYDMSQVAEACSGWRVGSSTGECRVLIQSGHNSDTFDNITINPVRLEKLDAVADLSDCILYEPPREGKCSENSEHPSQRYSWRPSQDDIDQVRREACGAILRTALCRRDSENADLEFRYDPETQESEQAEQDACGARTSTCPSDYESAGTSYTYWPAEQTGWAAIAENCGQRYRRGSWRVSPLCDALRGNVGNIATLHGTWIGDRDWTTENQPQVGVQCRRDKLGIWIHTGGYVGTAYRRGVQVQYRFGDSDVVSQDWAELISGSDSSAGAWIQEWQRRSFVDLLRQYEGEEFVIAVYG